MSSSFPRVAALGLATFLGQAPLYAGYRTDDSYIYARLARNLVELGELVFNPGQAVHAATSPVWAGVGAIGVWLGFDAFWTLKVSGWVCGALAVLVFARTATRLLPSPWALLATLVLATEPWLVRWSASGMETALSALTLIALLEAGLRPTGQVAWARLGVTSGLAPLVRPELLALSLLIAARVALAARTRGRLGFWLGLASPLVAWAAVAWPFYGALWPETVQAKSTPLGLQVGRLVGNVRTLAEILVVAAAAPVLAVGVGTWRRLRSLETSADPWLAPVLWFWIWLLPAVYLVRDVEVVSRYLEVILPAVILLGTLVVSGWDTRRAWRWVWTGQIGLALILTVAWISPSTRAFSRTLDAALGDIATWLAQNTREDEVVAIYDIGLVGYRSRRPILDLGGLVEPGLNDLRNEVDDEVIVRDGLFFQFGAPRFLVHRAAVPDALVETARFPCRPILHRTVANLGLSRGAPVTYTLYRVDPPREDG